MYEQYISVVLAALAVIILGCWNPPALQVQHGGKPSGHPSYRWLAFAALLVGLMSQYMMDASSPRGGSAYRGFAA